LLRHLTYDFEDLSFLLSEHAILAAAQNRPDINNYFGGFPLVVS